VTHTIGQLSQAVITVLEGGGKRRMVPTKVVVVPNSNGMCSQCQNSLTVWARTDHALEFTIVGLNVLSNADGTHIFEYIPTRSKITLDCIIDDANEAQTCSLPSDNLPVLQVRAEGLVVYRQAEAQRILRTSLPPGINARDFRAILYPSMVQEEQQQCYAVVVRHVTRERRNYLQLETSRTENATGKSSTLFVPSRGRRG
jgi:hypothetical protein